MALSSESKFFLLVLCFVCVIGAWEMFQNEFYNPAYVLISGGLTFGVIYLNSGTQFARLADPLIIDLRGGPDTLGVYGRYRARFSLGKDRYNYIIDVPNYIMHHIGKDGLIRGIVSVIRGDTPLAVPLHKSQLIQIPKEECALPETLCVIVDETTPDNIISQKLTKKHADLSYRYGLLSQGFEEVRKLAKSLEKETGDTRRATVEELGKTVDDLYRKVSQGVEGTQGQEVVS